MSPVSGLLRSRKFLVLVLDTVISMVVFFVGRYAAPEMAEDIGFLIAALQPVAVMLIGAIAYEDAAAKRAGAFRQAQDAHRRDR